MATTPYTVNYEDERFTQVEADKTAALSDLEKTYADMIGSSDKYYQDQINASKNWADQQSQLQQEQTDFTIEQINQQKDQSQKDYIKEQSGAYVDWQKQSNEYGVEAEKMASAGLANTGFSESSQVSMYNTYQNRVMTARESYNQAVLNYDNAIKDARLQNNSVLAEIAYNALQQQLELSLEGFQYKNQLILEKANKKIELDNTYYNRYLDVLSQINQENALAEDVRQFDEELAENIRQFNQSYDLQYKEYEEDIRQFNEEIARLKAKDEKEYQTKIKELELQKEELEQDQKQWEGEMQLEKQKLKSSSSSTSSKSSSSSTKKSSGTVKKSSSSSSSGTVKTSSGSNIYGVMELGYGPLNEDGVAEKVAQGTVKATEKNGNIYVEKTGNAYSKKLDQYTSLAKAVFGK